MSDALLQATPAVSMAAEAGGWWVVWKDEPDLAGKTAAELLALSSGLPGNFRYARMPSGDVTLLTEWSGGNVATPIEDVQAQLAGLLAAATPVSEEGAGAGAGEEIEEALEAAIDASGLNWSRRETTWAVPATDGLPRELLVTRVPAGARVEAVLAEWTGDLGQDEAQALAELLSTAQAGVRFARCEMQDHSARAVSLAATETLDSDLTHSLMGVAAACRLLAREAEAVLVPEVARAYLDFHRCSAPHEGQGDFGRSAGACCSGHSVAAV